MCVPPCVCLRGSSRSSLWSVVVVAVAVDMVFVAVVVVVVVMVVVVVAIVVVVVALSGPQLASRRATATATTVLSDRAAGVPSSMLWRRRGR